MKPRTPKQRAIGIAMILIGIGIGSVSMKEMLDLKSSATWASIGGVISLALILFGVFYTFPSEDETDPTNFPKIH